MNPHSAYLYNLLREELRSQDEDWILNNERKAQIANGYYPYYDIKRKFFVAKIMEDKLFCVYCQEPLKIYKGRNGKLPKDMATVDHFESIDSGGLKYVPSNYLCSCATCNNRRGNLPSFKVTETKYIF